MSKEKVLRFIVDNRALGIFIMNDNEIENLPIIVDDIFAIQNNERLTWSADQPMIFAFEIYKNIGGSEKYTTSTGVGLINISNITSIGIVEVNNRVADKYKKLVTYGAEND